MVEITKEKFLAYENVRVSGVTNMWAVDLVCQLSGGVLNEDDCLEIMKHYVQYRDKFMGKESK